MRSVRELGNVIMFARPVDLPDDLRRAVTKQHMKVTSDARCELLARLQLPTDPETTLSCLLCKQPLVRMAEHLAMAAITGGGRDLRDNVKQRVLTLMRNTGLWIPEFRVLVGPTFLMLSTPWPYRGELRALLVQAASNCGGIGEPAAPAVLDREDCSDFAALSSVPGEGSGHIDCNAFQRQLANFCVAYDSPFQSALRKLFAGTHARKWRFPLGCTVLEERHGPKVTWTLEFDDVETLERANVLLHPIMLEMERTGSHLRPESASVQEQEDQVLTEMPSLCITIDSNNRGARLEVASLLENLLLTLDRLAVHTDSAERAPAKSSTVAGNWGVAWEPSLQSSALAAA